MTVANHGHQGPEGRKPCIKLWRSASFASRRSGDKIMAKGQVRGNREAKKPKKEKPKVTAAAAPGVKIGQPAKKK